jgi:hypothetical protein
MYGIKGRDLWGLCNKFRQTNSEVSKWILATTKNET